MAIIMQITALAGNSSKPRAAQCFHGFLTGELQANCSWNVLSKSLTAFMSSGFNNSYIGILSSTCTNEMQYIFLYICTYIVKGSLYITMYLYIYVNIYIICIYIYIHIKNTVYILPVYCIQHTHFIVQMFSIAKVHKEY